METRKIKTLPAYLKDYICDMAQTGSSQKSPGLANTSPIQMSTPTLDLSGGARPKTKKHTDIVHDLDQTIEELTLKNKLLERDILRKKNSLLKAQLDKDDAIGVSQQKDKRDSSDRKTKSGLSDSKIPSLKTLRSSDEISGKAKALTKACIGQDSSSSDSSDSSDTERAKENSGNDFPYSLFKDKHRKKAVSGEARAAKDRVKYDVPWPHEHAQTKSMNYSDRDFGLTQLVRGEIFILQNIEKFSSSRFRQTHLINLLYLAEKFPFSEIKDFHAEVLRSIERGHKSWSNNFGEEQARTLVSPQSTTRNYNTRDPICGSYQAGNCSRSDDHFGSYGNKKLLHVCRKCVRKGKDPSDQAVRHPSKDCPNATA